MGTPTPFYKYAYGHLAGDTALHEVGKRLQEVVSSSGKVGRYGGEEFAIVLPQNDILQASQLAEQLRLRIAETPCIWQSAEQETPIAISITASIGIAIAPFMVLRPPIYWKPPMEQCIVPNKMDETA